MKPAARIGSLVRLKQGNVRFLGIVKSMKEFGDEMVSNDCTVILNVFWMQDPGLKIRPLIEEVDVLS